MPDYTVKADVDTMLRANDKAAIRSAIGVGTTDAPTFLAQTLTGQSLTGTQATSLVDLSATWNTTGTPSALKLNVTDTASNAASNLMDLQVGNVSKLSVTKTGQLVLPVINNSLRINSGVFFGTDGSQFYLNNSGNLPIFALLGNSGGPTLGSTMPLGWGVSANAASTSDTFLYRDGTPGILAQRNGSAAQAFRIYNTYTDANNYSRLKIGWDSATYTAFTIEGQQLGTGGGRNLALIGGGNVFGLGVTPSTAFNWVISAGNLLAGADNAHDIGASGANRPRDIYAGSNVRAPQIVASAAVLSQDYVQAVRYIINSGNGRIEAPTGDGIMKLSNNLNDNFNRLQLGGTTSAFPAIKRNGASLEARLADDSGYASFNAQIVTGTGYLISGSTLWRTGTGSPEGVYAAPVGSIFSRTDGGAATSFYVKESGTGNTGWVAK